MTDINQDHLYAKVSARIRADFLETHRDGFSFYDIISFFNWKETETKKAVSKWLHYESTKADPLLEKRNKYYIYIYKYLEPLDWTNVDLKPLELRWPRGIDDGTAFGFEKNVFISPGSVNIIAGVSNTGKTAFLMNFIIENMDKYSCLYMSNEFSAYGLKRRLRGFDWVDLIDGEGKPKFTAIKRYENWHHMLLADINVIDYMRLDDNTQVEGAIKLIQEHLGNKIAFIALQKPPGRDVGYGGQPTLNAASFYLAMEKGKLKVIKVKDKEGNMYDGKTYSFGLGHYGAKFFDIQEGRE